LAGSDKIVDRAPSSAVQQAGSTQRRQANLLTGKAQMASQGALNRRNTTNELTDNHILL
jgi:hypothetical protein